MAFSTTITGRSVVGNRRIHWGTFENGSGDQGGTFHTGLVNVEAAFLIPTSHSGSELPKLTFNSPSGGQIVVETSHDVDGVWFAFGF